MAAIWTGFLVNKLLETILVGTAPTLLLGVIVAIWRFSNRLQRNTDALNNLIPKVTELESDVQSLKNWRDLISAQAVAKLLKE